MRLFFRRERRPSTCAWVFVIVCLTALISCASMRSSEGPKTGSFAGPESEDYLLGPEDVLQVIVWENDKISKEVSIRPDGKISLPLIGEVQAAGMPASKLQEEIAAKLSEYKETPEVVVIVKDLNSYGIFVMGEVARPNKYYLRTRTTVLQAIAIAGGFTPWASKNDITVLRKAADGKESSIRVKYDAILSKPGSSQDIILMPGDTVVVP